MNRILNFSAGPSVLPIEVLQKASEELVSYGDAGMSVMEMSHRSSVFTGILEETKNLLKELMNISDDYEVLFLQGGASTQFSMIPLNLMTTSNKADVMVTGSWAKKAYQEMKRYGQVKVIASSEDQNFSYIPTVNPKDFTSDADLFHICVNNTIYGTRFKPDELPETGAVPLVGDMSSNILSEVYDVSKFGLIYAGAQKNMGPAGVTIVIIRKDLIGKAQDFTPTMFDYKIHADANSCYNTPPCYNIYICKLVYEWIKGLGGVEVVEKINKEKAQKLYDFIDNSKLFKGTVAAKDRSLMNVPFVTGSEELDALFIKESKKAGMENLKGHRSVGGMRASIYNAMPVSGVETLVDFMKKFETENA